jgi:uncharacterized RDD family membrane protein YckC
VSQGTAPPTLRTASWPRRILALFVDWTACTLVVIAVMGPAGWSESRYSSLFTMLVFVAESTVLTALVGGSFGKLATGLRVVGLTSGRPPSLLSSLLRVVLICLVVPPVVYKPDGRGLHDLAVHTATVPVGSH